MPQEHFWAPEYQGTWIDFGWNRYVEQIAEDFLSIGLRKLPGGNTELCWTQRLPWAIYWRETHVARASIRVRSYATLQYGSWMELFDLAEFFFHSYNCPRLESPYQKWECHNAFSRGPNPACHISQRSGRGWFKIPSDNQPFFSAFGCILRYPMAIFPWEKRWQQRVRVLRYILSR